MPNSNKTLRILRGGGTEASDAPQPKPVRPEAQAAAPRQAATPRQTADQQQAQGTEAQAEQPSKQLTPREEIEKIKQENLTGRQLRIARRMAQRQNLSPTSDLDAVRLLRRQGIDPFAKQEIGSVLAPVPAEGQEPAGNVALPATVRKNPVSDHKPQVIDDDSREREVRKIQRGLVKRRRKRLAILMVKLACYVFLPTFIAGYYFYNVATPMYATYSEFVIESAEAPGTTPGAGGLFGGVAAAAKDAITVQGFLTSRDAMNRLDEGNGFRSLYQGENVDVLQRFADDASDEDLYKIYKKRVIIGYDQTEGVIKMEVIAPTPEASTEISRKLIGYAEERVDKLTAPLREGQVSSARELYEEAEAKMESALNEVARLQREFETLSAEGDNAIIQQQISQREIQKTDKQLELARLTANTRPNETKVRILESEISLLTEKVNELRASVSNVVEINAELRKAESNLLVRQQLLAQSLQGLESTRANAQSQARYILMGVSPVTPDKAAYPRAFENTLLALVVFAGIYLMLSLTVSILREQVTT
jgi:capsular polysaccharide transport system permease protein